MTKPKAVAAPKAAAITPAAKADPHADHVSLDILVWNEAKGAAVPARLCSCGKRRAREG